MLLLLFNVKLFSSFLWLVLPYPSIVLLIGILLEVEGCWLFTALTKTFTLQAWSFSPQIVCFLLIFIFLFFIENNVFIIHLDFFVEE